MNESFITTVLARDEGRCCVCGDASEQIHFLLTPRLWDEPCFDPANALTLCQPHRIEAEQTLISVEALRGAARLELACLPPQFYGLLQYDHWGNLLLADGRRSRGELFFEAKVQACLAAGGALEKFVQWVKYPRTYLLPWSEDPSDGDRAMASTLSFEGQRVVVTEKMDGENVTLYRDYVHTRSLVNQPHRSRAWIEEFGRKIGEQIPPGWRVCGEYLYVRHSIAYEDLASFFLGFAVWDDHDVCRPWEETVSFFAELGIATVPLIYNGYYDEAQIRSLWATKGGVHSEGYILRRADAISTSDFRRKAGKFIRSGYTQSAPVKANLLHGVPITLNAINTP